jgi:predicted metal-binding membrane protein
VGYFFVWTVFGMAAFPLGVALATIEMQQPALARAVPIAVGVVVLIAGALQFTAWKVQSPRPVITWSPDGRLIV